MKRLGNVGRRSALTLHVGTVTLALLTVSFRVQAQAFDRTQDEALPDAPSTVLLAMAEADRQQMQTPPRLPVPCPPTAAPAKSRPNAPTQPPPCVIENPLRIVVNNETRQPLTSGQKGRLAFRDVTDPFNLLVIAAEAGVGVGANSHSAYGPGLKGFGRLTGYQVVQDAQGEFFGTYLIPSLVHEDPRYRRMQNASIKRRVFHALARTIIAEHDDGRPMPNYATLLTYPISAELSNLYVPGVQGNGPDTTRRIVIGLASDPASNLIAEFLPDIARRIHIRSVFIQQIVNNMALNPVSTTAP